jgi:hypothetical protein
MTEPVSEFKSKSGLGRIMPAMWYAMAGLRLLHRLAEKAHNGRLAFSA